MPKLDQDIMITQNVLEDGKGKMNRNGNHLAEFALLNNLFLTNTKFKQDMSYNTMDRTTRKK